MEQEKQNIVEINTEEVQENDNKTINKNEKIINENKEEELQNLYEQINLLNSIKKDIKEKIKKQLETEQEYNSIMLELEEVKKMVKEINKKKKNIMKNFMKKNEELYRELDVVNVKIKGEKERFIRELLRKFKENKEIKIYKIERGMKVRVDIELMPKFIRIKK